ncbi:GNAT family N-acetyltransferase [Sphingomonas sp. SUN039]|uniref:GNAT family N-acetyltransferase n=1 Tax=Sphingomonas sp. SUN039 TaxID=2937787 RepID=UPI002164207E|nr:GNAT family N-acetyltransferase [Sphingomonas sp. SUN039]UVO54208.1 N-acetyltransferase family protein [Sphingomonas sp. SUN039]
MTPTRPAAPADAPAIAAIYAHHVRHGTATFDTEAPSPEFWTEKIATLAARNWPFLVAEDAGEVVGYAYATQFRDRPAYARTCENSIYIRPGMIGRGIGTVLIAALLDAAAASGFKEMIAVAGGGEPASVALHTKAGFRHAGRMERVGEKFGRLLDTVYMQRGLTDPA